MKQLKNFLIKREQSQACLSFAKREKSRLLAKLILTFVALIAVTTGAWATAPTVYESGQTVNKNDLKVGDIILGGVTINGTNDGGYITMIAGRYSSDGNMFSFNSDVNRYPITVNADGSWKHPNASWVFAPIDASGQAGNAWEVTAKTENGSDYDVSIVGIYYGAPATFPFPITWDATNKTTGFNLPAGNVTVSVDYFPQAEFAMSTGETPVALAPTAIANVPANTDDPIVNPGTVANIGTSDDKQGTLMYYAVQSATAPTAPDYDATGWTDKVPTATDFAEGNVYVWYYIKGAEPASGTDRTDANTCSDSEITALGTTGYVTLAAAPTYAIILKEGTEESDKWDISPAEATKGTTITATYKGEKKVKSVKAVKKGGAVDPAKAYMKWDANQKKLVETAIPTTANKVQNSDQDVNWAAGTYVVDGEVTITGTITLSGDVNLIIKDGAKLTAQKISGNKNLSIYGQAQMTGELVVDNSGDDATTSIKTLEVHSAKVKATSSGNNRGGFFYTETFNVYGGSVDAENTAADGGYGIGLKAGGFMNIFGGEVKAVGKGNGGYSYGITASSSATVTVNGGKLWAENADKKAINTSLITIKKGTGFSGKIETSADNSSWTEYTEAGTPATKYVRVGY